MQNRSSLCKQEELQHAGSTIVLGGRGGGRMGVFIKDKQSKFYL